MPVFKKVSSANAELAVRDFFSRNNLSGPVQDLALKRELPSLQDLEGERYTSQEDMQELVDDQLDFYRTKPKSGLGLAGVSAGLGTSGALLAMNRAKNRIPSQKAAIIAKSLGVGLGAGLFSQLFVDHKLRNAYKEGEIKTSMPMFRKVSSANADLDEIAYYESERSKALAQLSGGGILASLAVGLGGLGSDLSERKIEKQLSAPYRSTNLDDAILLTRKLIDNSNRNWAIAAGVGAIPGLAMFGSGLHRAVKDERKNSKTSSDNSTGLMVGGGLGAGAGLIAGTIGSKAAGEYLYMRKQPLFHANLIEMVKADKLGDDTSRAIGELDKIMLGLDATERNWKIGGGIAAAAGLGALGVGLYRKFNNSKTSSDNSTGLMVGCGLGLGAGITTGTRVASRRHWNAYNRLMTPEIKDKMENLKAELRNYRGWDDHAERIAKEMLDIQFGLTQKSVATGQNWRIGGGLAAAAGLGALGLGLHRKIAKNNPSRETYGA